MAFSLAVSAQGLPLLTNLSQVRALKGPTAQFGHPVQARGVVTYVDPSGSLVFMQDATDGSFIGYSNRTVAVAAGDLVEIHGQSDPGSFNPCISFGSLTVVGRGPFPAPRTAPIESLNTGGDDSRWVRIEGVLRKATSWNDRTELEVMIGGYRLPATVAEPPRPDSDPADRLGSVVRLEGVCGVVFRQDRTLAGAQLFVPYWTNVVERQPRPKQLALTPLAAFRTPEPARPPPRQVRVRGRLVAQTEGLLTLRDGTEWLRVHTAQPSLARTNEWIEAVGFPFAAGGASELEDSTFHILAPDLAQFDRGWADSSNPAEVNDFFPVLTQGRKVLNLSEAEARRGQPVRFRGVVTYANAAQRLLFVQGPRTGLAVEPADPAQFNLAPGQAVEVDGFSGPGRFAPNVVRARLAARDARAAWPEPRLVTMDELRTGRDDGQWVQIQGVVRGVTPLDTHLALAIRSGDGQFRALVPGLSNQPSPLSLVDARVQLRGVASVLATARRQMTGVELYLPDLGHVVIQDPGAGDPFALQPKAVRQLFQFDPVRDSGRLVKVRGVVTANWQRKLLFLRDGEDALLVRPAGALKNFTSGQVVEAVGWPEGNARAPVLDGALCREVGRAEAPQPRTILATELVEAPPHGELVQLEARLLNVARGGESVQFQLREGPAHFVAFLDTQEAGTGLDRTERGARLRLTGVCLARADADGSPRTVLLYLRSREDAVVLDRPPWWKSERMLKLLSTIGALTLGALATWLFWRRRSARQTQLIRQQQRELAFSNLGHDLSRAASPREAGSIIVKVAKEILGWDACHLSLATADPERALVLVEMDTIGGKVVETESGTEIPMSPSASAVMREGPRLILREAGEAPTLDLAPFGEKSQRSASLMFVPIPCDGKAIGLFSIQSYRRHAYTPEDLKRLLALAEHCGGALARLRAQEVLRQSNEQLEQRVQERTAELSAAHAGLERRVAERTAELSRANEQLHQAVEALQNVQSEVEELANFTRFNPNPVLEFAADGRLTYFNDAAERMARSLNKQHPSEILPDRTPEIVAHCLASGQSRVRLETTIAERTLSWSFFPILPSRVVHCYAGDITERLHLEAQLRQALKMESIGRLAGGVAHDFNNLLTVIQGHAGLLMDSAKGNGPSLDSAREIARASERAANLTRQLLTFSRKQPMRIAFVDLNDLLGGVSGMLGRLIGEDILVQVEFSSQPAGVMADAGMVEQIILNLAVNARDAMPSGGKLSLGLSVVTLDRAALTQHPQGRPGPFTCLRMTDTGSGMDADTLSHIFEPFFTTKDVGKGTGLGLATVYGIVQQHAGWVEVQSELGRGSTFRVYLPTAPAPKLKAPPAEGSPSRRGGSETILVVEDEMAVRELAAHVLRNYGYEVLLADSGLSALKVWAAEKNKIDLLVTDIVMPHGLSGLEIAERMKKDKPDLRIVLSTGYSMDVEIEASPLYATARILNKPYPIETLAQTVRECLDEEGEGEAM
ncbi:MAG: response regulator [Verrucomicrobia bacterium]|nr:response regulator [Verrucomicrobiota bacterium]